MCYHPTARFRAPVRLAAVFGASLMLLATGAQATPDPAVAPAANAASVTNTATGTNTVSTTTGTTVTGALPAPVGPVGLQGQSGSSRPARPLQPVVHALVEQPRAFGYTVGDLLQQRIALGTPAAPFALAEAPRIGRIGASLWRRRSEEQVDRRGQHWLLIEYQLINTPQSLSVWYLPLLKLRAKNSSAVLTVDRAPFSIGPFTPPQPYEITALPALQPDQSPPPVSLAPIERRMTLAARALAAVLLIWAALIGWRHLRRGRHLPFARAVRDLQSPARAQVADPLAARRRLLHALNESAGEAVRPATVERLLDRAPYLAAERPALDTFVQESHGVFFGGRPAGDAAGVTSLARRLRRLERRHAA